MEDAFGTVVWVVAIIGVIVAVITLVGTGRSYREIGGGGLVRHDDDEPGGGGRGGSTAGAAAERDEEIRQMLEARSARRVRRGEAPLDVEAERAALERTPAEVDDGLREEIRDHVLARNARRVRGGAEPLDVEEEIERRIRDLT